MKKEVVVISAKYGTAGIWDYWDEKPVSGEEVFNFLMSDAGMQWFNLTEYCEKIKMIGDYCYKILKYFGKKEEYQIKGDLNIWYLGCNEKFGAIRYGDKEWIWNFAESSFDRVEEIIRFMYNDYFFTKKQYYKLLSAIEEGRKIDDAYEIGNYLLTKSKWWKSWKKPGPWRKTSEEFFGSIRSSFEDEGYDIKHFGDKKVS